MVVLQTGERGQNSVVQAKGTAWTMEVEEHWAGHTSGT